MKFAIALFFLVAVLSSCRVEYKEETSTEVSETSIKVSTGAPEDPEDATEVAESAPRQPELPGEVTKPEVSDGNDSEGHQASKPIGPEYPILNPKKVFTVVVQDDNYTPAQKEKLKKAEILIAKIFNSEEYKKEILSRKFTNDKGLSNQALYEKLFAGAEALQPAVNYQMDLKVRMYRSLKPVVGYTYPSDMKVYTNSRFYNRYDECGVASNLVHEWTHKMGFDHSSARDSKSVPYSHNAIVEALCEKFR